MTKALPAGTPDQSTLRKASLKVAVRISIACAVMVLVLLAVAALYLLNKLADPDLPPSVAAGTRYAYLDSRDLLEAMIIAGAAGIALAGLTGWLSARSAIRPLGEALALQRRFVQDASHELRTPLAILDARIQLAQRDAGEDAVSTRHLAKIREDTATLTGIVNELLLAATAAAPDPAAHPADLADVAGSVAESLQLLAAEKDIRLDFSAGGGPRARIEPHALRRAVLALADNALAHTPPGGRVGISVAAVQGQAVITVADSGPGIIGIDQDRIFDRFVRTAGPDGSHGQRSFGIGLSLVREIAMAAGGTVDVARTGADGTVMRIVLPAAAVPPAP
ncbi:HAMP domain-containing sensor histidine kinase [Arthrobacter sp. B3I4]|uniref:sensor histidine kinase n=1 Tax=Arthrobacter sp. B3I4 TaxID=3042267 RepID=UPI0027855896|nr:HAMP domain-containing sensor histidine kinase [Arthrobacter sp. B3I4]MDQ0756258.1 two-component system OmpR family sensor kinase [Arthrobacter sp. B3I4]